MMNLLRAGLAMSLAASIAAYANAQSQAAAGKELSPVTIRTFLRQPGGLQSLAKIAGNFVLQDKRPLFARSTLAPLANSSSLILIGHVSASTSSLIEDGDSILTTYTVVPEIVVKGVIEGSFDVDARGGEIKFADGTTARIVTWETEQIQTGGRYCLFLKDGQGKNKFLTNGEESIFAITGSAIQSAASARPGAHPIVAETRGMSLGQFLTKLQTIVQQQP